MDRSESAALIRIKRISKYAELFSCVGIGAAVSAFAFFIYLAIFDTSKFDLLLRENLVGRDIPVTIDGTSRSLIFTVGLFSVFLALCVFENARRLFAAFRGGRVFTFEVAKRISRIGWAIFAIAPVAVLSRTLNTIVLTFGNTEGQRQLSIGFNHTDIYAIVVGLMLVTLGRILHEATIISNENKSFV